MKLPNYITFNNRIIPLHTIDGFEINEGEAETATVSCEFHVNQDFRIITEEFRTYEEAELRFTKLQIILGADRGE